MLCERCKKNEATYYYHENVNGTEKTFHLCRDCRDEMEKKGELGDVDLSMNSLFESFFSDPFKGTLFGSLFAPARNQIQSGEKKCSCGMTLRELSANGMVGCPGCYDTFSRELAGTVQGIHGRNTHTGRVPAKFREKLGVKQKIEALEQERQEAVRNENYERAAEIRDELKRLRDGQ
ncbi:MAG: UvrB/UvrC motif-containing protein [Clostridia bacterium]|nr:UvrB/UvrC motif-containing protein [Clostridia bacterium]